MSIAGKEVAGSTLDDVTHMIKSGTRPVDISFLVPSASDIAYEDEPDEGVHSWDMAGRAVIVTVYVYLCVFVCVCIYIHIYMCVCVCVCVCVCACL